MTIAPGDTLDNVLGRAGIPPTVRAETALAIAGVCDLTDLRPGHRLSWVADKSDATRLLRLSLFVDDGVEINLSFNGPITAERLDPPIREVDRRETLTLQGPLFEALVAAKAPERFAVDLTALLAGRVDFRRDIKGGESFALVWREDQLPDGTIRACGLTVDIDHGGVVVTRYAHLSEIADTVEQGTRSKAGNRIDAVGATGLVNGPNLHYEVRVDGRPIDPTDREALPDQEIASVDDLNALATWRRETDFTSAKMEDRG